jgi:hypothetical protein
MRGRPRLRYAFDRRISDLKDILDAIFYLAEASQVTGHVLTSSSPRLAALDKTAVAFVLLADPKTR